MGTQISHSFNLVAFIKAEIQKYLKFY